MPRLYEESREPVKRNASVHSRSFIAILDRRKSRRNAVARGLSANVESSASETRFGGDKICEKKNEYI